MITAVFAPMSQFPESSYYSWAKPFCMILAIILIPMHSEH